MIFFIFFNPTFISFLFHMNEVIVFASVVVMHCTRC